MLEDDIKGLTVLVQSTFGRLENAIARLETKVDDSVARLDDTNARLDGTNARLDGTIARLARLEDTVKAESAETREYVDLRVGELKGEMMRAFQRERGHSDDQFTRQRQLIGTEFAKAAGHADRLYEVLRKQIGVQPESAG